MKKLNKDSSTMKNTVEAYLCASCSFCHCDCICQVELLDAVVTSVVKEDPAEYGSLNIRQF